jgi:hypothetical protein
MRHWRHINGHQPPAEFRQSCPQITSLISSTASADKAFSAPLRDKSGEKPLLAAELAVDTALGATYALTEGIDTCGGVTLFEEDLGRRLEANLTVQATRLLPIKDQTRKYLSDAPTPKLETAPKKQQMRWNRTTVRSFLNVRTAVLNDNLEKALRHRYPGFRPTNEDQVLSEAA